MVSPEILRRFPYLAGVSEDMLKQVAMISEEKTVRKGDVLFREGEDATHLYIIVEGEVDIQYELGDGTHQTVDTVVAGDFTLWTSLIKPHTTHSIGMARTNLRLVAIDAPKLRDLMEADPLLGYRIMDAIATAVSHRLLGARLQVAAM
jgi:CRP-like cAMP-binding protein